MDQSKDSVDVVYDIITEHSQFDIEQGYGHIVL